MKINFITLFLIFALLISSENIFAQESESDEKTENHEFAKKKYKMFCSPCHGSYGTLTIGGAMALTKSKFKIEERVEIITNGKNLMTPFKGILKEDEIEAIAKYLDELIEE